MMLAAGALVLAACAGGEPAPSSFPGLTVDGNDAYLASNRRGKHGQVVYDLHGDFGVDVPALRRRFQFYYDRFPVAREKVTGE